MRLGGFTISFLQEYRNRTSMLKKGAYRIMCLGESTTRDQYPSFLEEVLNQRNIGIRFSVIDKGVAGNNTSFILAQLESNLDTYKPDMVIAMMGVNDHGSHMPPEPITNSRIAIFFGHLRVYKLARFLWLHISTKIQEKSLYKPNSDKQPIKKVMNSLENDFKEDFSDKSSYVTKESFEKVPELNSNSDNKFIKLGWLYTEQGKFFQAEEYFKKAIEINPKNEAAYIALGKAYCMQGKFFQAEECLKKVIGNDIDAIITLARVYVDQRKFFQAEECLKKVIGNDIDAIIILGWLYTEQGKLSQAEECFKKAVEINPENEFSYLDLGWLYTEQGKLSQAEEYFKKAVEINPGEDRLYRALATFYQQINNQKLAEEYHRKANRCRIETKNPLTISNYRKLKEILDKRGVRLICVQYPMRSIEPLKKVFENEEGIIFVDNEKIFKSVLKNASYKEYKEYFKDMFGGDFGHCTEKGNRLLAENIANTILKEAFDR